MSVTYTRKLEADIDNLRFALEWSLGIEQDPLSGIRIINALGENFFERESIPG